MYLYYIRSTQVTTFKFALKQASTGEKEMLIDLWDLYWNIIAIDICMGLVLLPEIAVWWQPLCGLFLPFLA